MERPVVGLSIEARQDGGHCKLFAKEVLVLGHLKPKGIYVELRFPAIIFGAPSHEPEEENAVEPSY